MTHRCPQVNKLFMGRKPYVLQVHTYCLLYCDYKKKEVVRMHTISRAY